MLLRRLLLALVLLSLSSFAGAQQRSSNPLPPQRALASFHLQEGFEIELVASEPQTSSPVAIDWGSDGRLWIVEMADYPNGIDSHGRPGGRVRILESTHNDGHYDKSTLFLDGLNMPNGLSVWRNGVIVTAAPDILYVQEADGKAGDHRVLFTGFDPGNPQLRVNGLRWGMDGWLYCANGWSGGYPRSVVTGQKISIERKDVRLEPDTGAIEAQSGMSEFGRDCDDWGDWFGCDNSHPLFHFVLDEQYTKRFPSALLPDPKVQVIVPANPKVYPISKPQSRFYTDAFGYFTSACSATIYRDELLFPGQADQHMFVCEPAYNLLHHEILRDRGVSFSAARPKDEQDREFLASDDQWFRPVTARTGPDGALWVVDMYRYMIEHPDWLPPEGKKALAPFYRDGADRGRIYRIYPKGHPPRPVPRLDRMSTAQLVKALDSPNGTLRDMVQKQLFWRADQSAIEPLRNLTKSSSNPAVRIQTLYTISLLHGPMIDLLRDALHDSHPAVRRNAVRLCENSASPELVAEAVKLSDDPDPKVRLQLACSLGNWQGPEVEQAVRKMADHADDPYIAAALMSGAGRHFDAILDSLARSEKCEGPLYESALAAAVAADNPDAQEKLLAAVLKSSSGTYTTAQFRAFGNYLHDIAARSTKSKPKSLPNNASSIFSSARRVAANERESADRRAAATGLLGKDDFDELSSMLTPQCPSQVQKAAIRSMASTGDDRVPQILTRDWSTRSPQLRTAILDVMLAREPWTFALLKSVESGAVPQTDFDSARRERLVKSRSDRVRSLAQKLLGSPPNPQRQQVAESYRRALKLQGDIKRGASLFLQNCAVCHKKNGVGADIGPDLNSVRAWQSEALLVAILDPSREVQPQYLAYSVTLSSGDVLYGLLASESGDSITVRGLDGSVRTAARTQIKSVAGTNRSLMPDGLESALSPQGMADVIAFLQSPATP